MIARAVSLLLDRCDPRQVLYRSARSVLEPRLATECEGVVPRVVFPAGVDVRPDGELDVYYGMADSRIGVARACLADLLTPAHVRAA
jgi:beta-1,2-mannobiose phosphorylase / 1,2-beta-oligomannan phosphorylase